MEYKEHTVILAVTFKTYHESAVWATATHLANALETDPGISAKVKILDAGGLSDN